MCRAICFKPLSDFVKEILVLLSMLQHRVLINRERELGFSRFRRYNGYSVWSVYVFTRALCGEKRIVTSGAFDTCTAARGSATARR